MTDEEALKLAVGVHKNSKHPDTKALMEVAISALRERIERRNPKTNGDYFRVMSDEELAKNNIQAKYICSTDANGNWEVQYKTSDDTLFWDEDSAIEYELNWLRQPYKEKEDGNKT